MGEDPSKVTNKPRSKLGSAKSPTKRLAASENNSNQESKRAKKKAVDSDVIVQKDLAKKTGDDMKKQLFQSLWSEDDEIVILKGKIEYTAKKRFDPLVDINAFYDFIKKLLYINVSKAQLSEKVRRLNKKYENNASKSKMGKDRTFRDANVYKLIGPVLVKQDLAEANANVRKRIDYISAELKRLDATLQDLEEKQNSKKDAILKLQQRIQSLQAGKSKA
ncbi:Prefoldin subunit 6 [Camellia lanceoleosa]|uniref:Prefoldin subunit 6 n=1 Tax=Camellia lanceoleosa TaxID=1840588 RepID=A0ACC0F2K1_9ERIC|nr:Prefoldin subunit 6 [Camellia lanceoleosa]